MQEQIGEVLQFIFLGLLAIFLLFYALKKKFLSLPPQTPSPIVRFSDLLLIFVIYLVLVLALPLLLFSLFTTFSSDALDRQADIITWSQLLSFLITAFCLYFFCYTRPHHLLKQLFKKETLLNSVKIGVLTWLVAFPLTAFIGQLMDFLVTKFSGLESPDQIAVRYFKSTLHQPELVILSTILIVFVAPCVEELLFRGFLQNFLKQHVSRKTALILTALAFACFHFSGAQGIGNISLIFSLFTFALFLGFVYEKTGSLFSSIALHMTFNGLSVIGLLFQG